MAILHGSSGKHHVETTIQKPRELEQVYVLYADNLSPSRNQALYLLIHLVALSFNDRT